MTRKEIDVDINEIEELFKRNYEYRIPLFQRDYDWNTDHVQEFWDDLISHFNTGNRTKYFFGSIMLVNESDTDELYTVIDGQQRLTTSLILLIAFRDYFLEVGLTDEVDILNKYIHTEDENKPRLELNVYNKDFFATKILEERKITEKIKYLKEIDDIQKKDTKLRDSYTLLAEQIKKFEKDDPQKKFTIVKLYEHFVRWFTVVEHTISDLRQAYRIFENINHKGLRLDQNDLVKNHLMETIHVDSKGMPQDEIDKLLIEADNKWQRITHILEHIKVDEDKFLRYYLMAFVKSAPKDKIYETIKKEYVSKDSVSNLLMELETKVHSLSMIRRPTLEEWGNDQDLVDELTALSFLSDGGMYPILLLGKEKFSMPQMKRLVTLVTKLFFRVKTVCSVNYSEIEHLVEKICIMLREEPARRTVDDIKNEMLTWSKYPRDEFEILFKKLELPQKKAKYALSEIYYEMVGGRHTASSSISSKAEVEHIMPQKISGTEWEEFIKNHKKITKAKAIDAYHKDYVNKLGNMTLLNKSKNRSISNSSFDNKKDYYAKDDLKITSKLADEILWDESRILNRQAEFYIHAKNIWDIEKV